MKFVPKPSYNSSTAQYSGNRELEDYIFNTKDLLDTHLSQVCSPDADNITPGERKAITCFATISTIVHGLSTKFYLADSSTKRHVHSLRCGISHSICKEFISINPSNRMPWNNLPRNAKPMISHLSGPQPNYQTSTCKHLFRICHLMFSTD